MLNNEETPCEYFRQANRKVAHSVLEFLLGLLAVSLGLVFLFLLFLAVEETFSALWVVGFHVFDDEQASYTLIHQPKAVAGLWLLFLVPAVWFSVVCLQNPKKIGVYAQGLAQCARRTFIRKI